MKHVSHVLPLVLELAGASCAHAELMGGPGARSDRVGFALQGSDPWTQVAHQSRSDRENSEHSES